MGTQPTFSSQRPATALTGPDAAAQVWRRAAAKFKLLMIRCNGLLGGGLLGVRNPRRRAVAA